MNLSYLNTMQDYVVQKKISLNATPEQVWSALTNPEKTKQYFFNCAVYSDWEVGSTIVFTGRLFLIKKIEMKGQILEIEPNKLLKYSLENEEDDVDPDSFSTVTDELTYENGQTILSITDDVGQGKGAQERFERSEKGWDKILQGLKELVENEQ
ncbi:SRPBCC domain-containing protein [Spirosoma sp. KNUC1025]|uniref:SRPBCC domain-containing protein n=1 Tax=Spirosoma sp. KNUC1025 TaxID=2894082 RepID=UPI003867C9C3|nr:SRPBCC domain-containing protein [Spirosoma sp. KNUC1025]